MQAKSPVTYSSALASGIDSSLAPPRLSRREAPSPLSSTKPGGKPSPARPFGDTVEVPAAAEQGKRFWVFITAAAVVIAVVVFGVGMMMFK